MPDRVLLPLLALVLACQPDDPGDDPGSTGSSTTADETSSGTTTASSLSDPTAGAGQEGCIDALQYTVKECAQRFCPPGDWPLSISNSADGPGLAYEWAPPGLLNFRHRSSGLDTIVGFTDTLGDARDDAALLAHFAGLSFTVTFPAEVVRETPLGSPLNHDSARIEITDTAQFESFAFESGRLRATWSGEVNDITYFVHSDAEQCVRGDIAGQCSCHYGGAAIPVTIELDLSIDG